jgi:hypothetical protein
MAKAAVTRHRFRISAEIAAEELGLVLVQFSQLGLENVDYEIITDVRTFHNNPDRKMHGVKAETFIVETFLTHHNRFRATDLIQHFKAHGRAPSAIYYALGAMTKAGILRKTDDGYEVSPKQLAAPKRDEATGDMFDGDEPTEEGAVKKWDRTAKDEILDFIAGRESFTTKELRELFKEQGRMENSVSPTLNKLLTEKRIKRTGAPQSGEYLVVKSKRPAE